VKIISRYVLKEHVGPFVFASSALTSLMLLQYVAKKFGDLVGKGLPAGVIAEFMALSIPFTIAMTLPMAVLVSVLYAFSRLASENEITAMKASGVSMWRLLRPVLFAGFGLSVVMLVFNDQVLPRSNHRLAVLQLDIFRTKPTFALREQVINTVKEGQLYLRAGAIDEATSKMKDVVIYDLADPAHRRTIYADSGRLALASNRRDLEMTLHHGVMIEVSNGKPGQLSRMFYKKDRMRVKGVISSYQESQTGTVSKGDREMSVCEMNRMMARADLNMRMAAYDGELAKHELLGAPRPEPAAYRLPPGIGSIYCKIVGLISVSAAKAQQPGSVGRPQEPAKTSAAIVQQAVDARVNESNMRVQDARLERNRFDVEIQKKFSLAAACLIFVLIGAPLALRFPRGGVGLVIGVSFGIFGIYYVGLIGGETLANKGYLPPWLAMWAANMLLAFTGLILAIRMGTESSTARGSELEDAVARVLAWFGRRGRQPGISA
jgi:lipopolysaccharide export system permease protein